MSERRFARLTVVSAVASVLGALFFLWAELNWKNLGSRAAVFAVTLAGAALGALWAWRMARRPTPIDWIHELVRTAMLAALLGGTGALVSHLGDLAVPGQAQLGNNQPNTWSPLFVTLLVASSIVAMSSVLPVWRHRYAVRVQGERPLADTLAACGAWLAAVAFVFALLGVVVEVDLARPFAPVAGLALFLLIDFPFFLFAKPPAVARWSRPLATTGAALAAFTGILALTGFPLLDREAQRDAEACRAAAHPGLFLDARASRVTAYRARGATLRRVECRTTFQYNDERHIALVGRDVEGRDLQGSELFLRVVGTPLERARAACEILLADRCEAPLAYPSQIAGVAAGLPTGGALVPYERSGKLAFFAITHDYPNGRGTTLGRRRVLVAHEVDLSTGHLVGARR